MSDALSLLLGLVSIGGAIGGGAWMLSARLRGLDDDVKQLCGRMKRIEQHLGLNGKQ